MTNTLETLEIESLTPATTSIIWLHGLGADGHDFEPIVPELGLTATDIKFIFPHAPKQAVSINNGLVMRAWYDITVADLEQQQDIQGIERSSKLIEALIEQEIAQNRKVILAGFSQGGVVALHTALRFRKKLTGVLALSCYLAAPEQLHKEKHEANQETPIMMMHGSEDPVIVIRHAEQSRDTLMIEGYPFQWKRYPMAHSIHPQQIIDIASWITRVIDKDK